MEVGEKVVYSVVVLDCNLQMGAGSFPLVKLAGMNQKLI